MNQQEYAEQLRRTKDMFDNEPYVKPPFVPDFTTKVKPYSELHYRILYCKYIKHMTIRQTALKTGLGRTTIHRWFNKPHSRLMFESMHNYRTAGSTHYAS